MKEWLSTSELQAMAVSAAFPRRSLFRFLEVMRTDFPELVRAKENRPLVEGKERRIVKQRGILGHQYHYLCLRKHLEGAPVDTLAAVFPNATKVTVDLTRPVDERILVRMRATGIKRPA
jgi:hypothetical protein